MCPFFYFLKVTTFTGMTKKQKPKPKPDLDYLNKVTNQINKGRSDKKSHESERNRKL